jgi:hypothetical protein
MQVTELQVQRSLQALSQPDATQAEPETGLAEGSPRGAGRQPGDCPEGLVEALSGSPAIRDDRLAEARRRLETGEQPSAEDLAQRLVGRLVCDRLR